MEVRDKDMNLIARIYQKEYGYPTTFETEDGQLFNTFPEAEEHYYTLHPTTGLIFDIDNIKYRRSWNKPDLPPPESPLDSQPETP